MQTKRAAEHRPPVTNNSLYSTHSQSLAHGRQPLRHHPSSLEPAQPAIGAVGGRESMPCLCPTCTPGKPVGPALQHHPAHASAACQRAGEGRASRGASRNPLPSATPEPYTLQDTPVSNPLPLSPCTSHLTLAPILSLSHEQEQTGLVGERRAAFQTPATASVGECDKQTHNFLPSATRQPTATSTQAPPPLQLPPEAPSFPLNLLPAASSPRSLVLAKMVARWLLLRSYAPWPVPTRGRGGSS